MEIINRIKSILVSPKTEWQTIEAENFGTKKDFDCAFSLVLAAILIN